MTAILFLLFAHTAAAFSPFRVASIFSEHAVLQRAPASSRVWGWAAPGSTISVHLNCSAAQGGVFTTNVTADGASGLWISVFPPQRGSPVPCYASFTDGSSAAAVWYLDIVFGEVLVCGG